jgi:MFS family permease
MGNFLQPFLIMKFFGSKSAVKDCHDDRVFPHTVQDYDVLNSISRGKEVLGIPSHLLPYYAAFALDAVAVGLVMPLLPFTLMELGANAFQLSLVVSSNYVAQSIGVTIIGRVSDTHGRKVVMIMCLLASTLSYALLSQAESLVGIALARIISGSFGGLIPIIQSAVADSTNQLERPKYLGRIMATFGLGFVLGPAVSTLLVGWTTRQKIQVASILPFLGFLAIYFLGKETKKDVKPLDICIPLLSEDRSSAEQSKSIAADSANSPPTAVLPPSSSKSSSDNSTQSPLSAGRVLFRSVATTSGTAPYSITSSSAVGISSVPNSDRLISSPLASRSLTPTKSFMSLASTNANTSMKRSAPTPIEIYLLVLNGFCIMFAFATESIYAIFIKDSFGYGEGVLSTIFAINGLFIGLFQVFFIKPMISAIGKHATLAVGNIMLALGMIGVALVRDAKSIHFAFFAAHVVGYSIADTTLASLISKYSSPSTQGRDLALNQAAQAFARVMSPVVAGMLYEYSKLPQLWLPIGALPFLFGGLCPLVAMTIPTYLYVQKRERKRRQMSLFTDSNSHLATGWHSIAPRWLQASKYQTTAVVGGSMDSMYDFAVSSDSNSDAEGVTRSNH